MPQRLILAVLRIVDKIPHGSARDRARAILFAGAGRPFGLSADDINAILALALDACRILA